MPSRDTENTKLFSQVWSKICTVLSRELSEQSFKTWLEPIHCIDFNDHSITLAVPDSYYCRWLKEHYEELIISAILEVFGSRREVKYLVEEQTKIELARDTKAYSPPVAKSPIEDLGFNSKYTFDQFVIGPGNRFAHAAAMAVCEAPARNYNPLFIYGPVGLGKTHLMQSIAHEIKQKFTHFKILYITSEKFTNQLISAIQSRSTHQFRNRYRTLDLLLIDDIHFIAEKESTQEEFFHTFNALYDAHKQIVVSSDRPPKEIPGLEERLVSRFGWGLVTDIQPPDFETRVAILRKKMERETVMVPDDVSYFIASKIKSNIRELEGALIRVVAYSTLTGEPLSLKLAQTILRDTLKEEEQKISIEKIQRVVSEYFNLRVSDLRSKRRTRSVAGPRQIAMYLVRTMTGHSLPEIGEYFGGRDHTTVIHSFQKVEGELKEKKDMVKIVEEIKELLTKKE
ncbi:MAG: chromosomal replication initiator protein DnaA [Candidatus Omnitrophica bacterium]|nr:chromosomal replication initiator protein DnaA [Candidatus Omnitrophota bacterium]MDD5670694.1 chromosomal replication initiator protein DnaA [Candidatus Omnitrophota bacterium]